VVGVHLTQGNVSLGVDMSMAKSVLVISWHQSLAKTREMLLSKAGYIVTSAVGRAEAALGCGGGADLLVLGHSVPSSEKKEVIACYRQYSTGPILSLLRSDQQKLPEADFGVEAFDPAGVVQVVRKILDDEPLR
jgi:CheY-like chemotaxis protein